MAINTTTTRASYSGDGTTTAFAVPFVFFGPDEIEVIERTIATGAETTKTRPTHYTVSGGNGSTGTVTAVTAAPAGVEWHVRRKTKRTQETQYNEGDPFAAKTHERALDRGVALSQEIEELLSRALLLPKTDPAAPPLPTLEQLKGKVIAVSTAGALVGTSLAQSVTQPLPIAEGGTAATTAAGARAALGCDAVYQPLAAALSAIAALTTQAFGRSALTWADFGAGRAALFLVPGTDVQIQDADLQAIADQGTTSWGRALLALGDAAALRSTAGLGTLATQNANSVSITGGSIAGVGFADLNGGALAGLRNAVINGDFQIDQYGLGAYAPTTAMTYFVDRWAGVLDTAPTGTLSFQRVSSGLVDSPWSVRMARFGGTYAGKWYLAHVVETADSRRYAGRTVTVSFRARKGSDSTNGVRATLFTGTGTDQTASQMYAGLWTGSVGQTFDVANASLTTSWQSFSASFSVGASATQVGLMLQCLNNFTGGGTGNDWIEFTDVQIEPGAVATPFERRPAALELALAQRFYATMNHSSGAWGISANDVVYPLRFPVQMRAAPTMSLRTTAPAFNDFNIGVTGTASTLVSAHNVTEQGAALRVNGFTGLTASRPGFHNASTALASASAEL